MRTRLAVAITARSRNSSTASHKAGLDFNPVAAELAPHARGRAHILRSHAHAFFDAEWLDVVIAVADSRT
jgi:hypothetical protein